MTQKPRAFISSISFSGGQSFTFSEFEKVIIVGPNNSGKSLSLREMCNIASEGDKIRTNCVKSIKIEKTGNNIDLENYLEKNAIYNDGSYILNDWRIPHNHIDMWSIEYLRGPIFKGYMKNITADERLRICDQAESILSNSPKSKPQHIIYDNSKLMKKISDLFNSAFNKELIIDFRGGASIPIHVGESPPKNLKDRVSDEYVSHVRKNPLLDQQGDGMRSYAGILFESIVTERSITLIDEPEAFLHPPQMRKLGETLSSEVKNQLFVSTHSSDVMRGFLEGTRGRVRILRIRRDGDLNLVSEASPQAIQELWEKPNLRYSNALEGIFHEQTIICEDDSDCRLINSVADHLALGDKDLRIDTAFVPTGGKFAIPKTASVLRKIGVPVKAVFDMDFLSEIDLVKSTVEAFGAPWADFEAPWKRVDAAVRKGIQPKTAKEIRSYVCSIIKEGDEDSPLPRGKIIEAMKQTTPWSVVKKFGEPAIPKGEAQKEYRILRDGLEAIGIYLIPVGEIENFCPTVAGHGPKFVTGLLSSISLDNQELDGLRQFVRKVQLGSACP